MRKHWQTRLVFWAVMLPTALMVGCALNSAPTTQPLTPSQQQDLILNDPMNYKPVVGREITGGDITHFDHGGFDKDMNDALNP